jgi:hypothetical protein
MTLDELTDLIFADVTPEQTGQFATLLKQKIMAGYSTDQLKIIADQLEQAGITIVGIQCKASPA